MEFFSIKVSSLGDDKVLLSFGDTESMNNFLEEDWLNKWYSEINAQNAMQTSSLRFFWVKLYRVPLHLWSPHFFHWIGLKLGQFIQMDNYTAASLVQIMQRYLFWQTSLDISIKPQLLSPHPCFEDPCNNIKCHNYQVKCRTPSESSSSNKKLSYNLGISKDNSFDFSHEELESSSECETYEKEKNKIEK